MSKTKLIRLLQNAHAGERAAAYAYRGHALAVDAVEAAEIRKIEMEEWEHRRDLAEMLRVLGSGPRRSRELLMAMIGCVIFMICRLGGWLNFLNFGWYSSMYGAGKLERGNIVEYEIAAQYAREAGYPQFVEPLLVMAEIEWDHEAYFRGKCESSKWAAYLKIWPPPPARALIRANAG